MGDKLMYYGRMSVSPTRVFAISVPGIRERNTN
jgi:hypothetical protein